MWLPTRGGRPAWSVAVSAVALLVAAMPAFGAPVRAAGEAQAGGGGAQGGLSVRVGVYENPPIVSTRGRFREGIAIDVLEAVGQREAWAIDYHPCAWADCLTELDVGRIDLLVGMAYTDERASRYRFGEEALISNYGVVYAGSDASIGSLLDLEGRRVALMDGNIHADVFRRDMATFGLPYAEVVAADFEGVVAAVLEGRADAGVVNRLFSLDTAAHGGLQATGIVFNPIEIRYAAPWDSAPQVLAAMDAGLRRLKADPGSVYHRSLQRWMGSAGGRAVPPWWRWALIAAAGLLAVALLANVGLRRLVKHRTWELQQRSLELQSEVRQRQKAQDDLARITLTDPLTGLPTRFVLVDRLQQAMRAAALRESRVGVLKVDIDRFRSVNQLVGQTMADSLFERVVERLAPALPAAATLGRLEGDEVLAVVPGPIDEARLAAIAQAILEAMREPVQAGDRSLVITVSVGGVLYPDDGSEPEELLARADAAVHEVKVHGRDGYRHYTPDMAPQILERQRIELRLRRAIADGAVEVHFQPIVALDTGELRAAEALIRIPGMNGDMLYPERFIPIAEEAGLIHGLGRLALERSASAAREWLPAVPTTSRMAINVSPHQFEDVDFLDHLDAAVGPTGFPLSRLELELTEGVYLERLPARTALLSGLENRSVELSIDDFGTGYSSLGYLKRLPVGTVKIDQSFVQDAPTDRRAAEIVKAVVHLARGLGIRCVAEGIETLAQMRFLREVGCPLGQGFLLSPPLPTAGFSAWLADLPATHERLGLA